MWATCGGMFTLRVFMGDTGSMFLGASFGLLTLRSLIHAPEAHWWGAFTLMGLVFAAEILSVVVQLSSVKLRGGRRIFRATPITIILSCWAGRSRRL